MIRPLPANQLAFDVALALLLALSRLGLYGGASEQYLMLLGLTGALALRRLSPALALALAWATALWQVYARTGPDPFDLVILAVLYATAAYGGRVLRWYGFSSALLGAAAVTFSVELVPAVDGARPIDAELLSDAGTVYAASAVVFLLSWTLGLLARTWQTARESRRAQAAAERERTVEQERTRIAREMHDIVAHSLAVVIAQADGARYSRDPDASQSALATIAGTAREALGDVRLLLSRMRHSQGELPQPGVAEMPALLEQLRDSGMPVEFVELGEPRELGAGHQLAVYRIVQEALTNALRHGDAMAGATVRVDWREGALALRVSNRLGDTPRRGDPQHTGHGLPGMIERAELAGGSLSAGPHGELFVVEAVFAGEGVPA